MSKIETLARNISVIRYASAQLDLSVLHEVDATQIQKSLEQIAELCQVYIDFETGLAINPDKESE